MFTSASLRGVVLLAPLMLLACGAVDPLALRSPQVDKSWTDTSSHPQRVFLSQFRDERPVRDRVGTAASAMGIRRGPLVLQREPVAVARDAIELGIRARGHHVVADPTEASVVLDGELKELWVETLFQPIGAERFARVAVRLSARRGDVEGAEGTRTLHGETRVYAGNQIAIQPVVEALQGALQEIARSAATDEGLDTIIQRAASRR